MPKESLWKQVIQLSSEKGLQHRKQGPSPDSADDSDVRPNRADEDVSVHETPLKNKKPLTGDDVSSTSSSGFLGNMTSNGIKRAVNEPVHAPIQDKHVLQTSNTHRDAPPRKMIRRHAVPGRFPEHTSKTFCQFIDEQTRPGETWAKIGEASFSEVMRRSSHTGDVVIKIIPLKWGRSRLPYSMLIEDVNREIRVLGMLAQLKNTWKIEQPAKFVPLLDVHHVEGAFPAVLLDAWDKYAEEAETQSEQVRPDASAFPSATHFAILTQPDGGQDLEAFHVRDFVEALDILLQIMKAFELAEQQLQFEHRDLHWGNVLIRRIVYLNGTYPAVTIIDFGLSRCRLDEEVVYYPLSREEGLFDAEPGAPSTEPQVNRHVHVYPRMRLLTRSRWAEYHPQTNVLWINYIANVLLYDKGLVRPEKVPENTRAWRAWDLVSRIERRSRDPAVYKDTLHFNEQFNFRGF